MQYFAQQLSTTKGYQGASKLLVFTDLDGTLLDHDSYSYEAALPSLNQLKQLNIPIIFNTSKTFMEVLQLQKKMGLQQPFAIENGSALCIPADGELQTDQLSPLNVGKQHWKFKTFGPSYPDICQHLSVLRQQHHFRFQGFNDMNVSEVQLNTGLAKYDAQLAKQRMASEPLLWNDSDAQLKIFISKLEAHNLAVVKGGRFYHVKAKFDKADAMQWLKQLYQHQYHHEFTSIALGDSENDRSMLERADIPVVIPRKHDPALMINHPNSSLASHPGPYGWHQSIQQILHSLINGA